MLGELLLEEFFKGLALVHQETHEVSCAMQASVDQDRLSFDLVKGEIVVDDEDPIAQFRDCSVIGRSAKERMVFQGMQPAFDAIERYGCCSRVLRGQIGKQFLQIPLGDREESDDIII